MRDRIVSPSLVVVAGLFAACTGGVSGGGGQGGGSSGSGAAAASGASGRTGAGGAAGSPAGSQSACGRAEPSPSPLRRLTRLEYNNTVRDLLGTSLAPADRFPPDEIAGGFSNNATVLSVSPLLAERYMEAAELLAAEAAKNLGPLLPCDPARTGEEACARQFVERFGRRAYRRPLAADEVTRLLKVYAAGRADATFARGLEVTIRAVLQSPSFLYRFETGVAVRSGETLVRLTQHEIAARLSYFLWASMPDDKLAAAADAGQLGAVDQIAKMARAMLDDRRSRRAVTEFYRQWLGLGELDTLAKDPAIYPEFTDELRAAMRAELPAFVEHVLWTGDRRLSTLLLAPIGFVTAPLARLYGVPAPAGVAPQMVALKPAERVGVLTQAGVLTVHALPNQSSPVNRGKLVREHLLCQEAPPPPPNLMVTPPEVDPTRSTRERFAQHTKDAACAACHELLDPLGFGFENFDGIGRYRTTDGGRPVDASGRVVKSRDIDGAFRGARELGDKLAASAEVRDCFATQWFRFALGRYEGPADACALEALGKAFAASGGDARELLVALTQTDAFLYRRALTPQEVSP